MDKAAEVYETSGLRGALSVSTMDEEGLPASIAMTAEEAIEKTDILFERFHGKGNLKVFYSLRSLISCSEDRSAYFITFSLQISALREQRRTAVFTWQQRKKWSRFPLWMK